MIPGPPHTTDQCGVPQGYTNKYTTQTKKRNMQTELFKKTTQFIHVTSVIGSGYESDVATLAIQDGIAMRAARKNMQIHSAIILKVDDAFAGFFTFQINDECKEFCFLQSVIEPAHYTHELYREMVLEVLSKCPDGYQLRPKWRKFSYGRNNFQNLILTQTPSLTWFG